MGFDGLLASRNQENCLRIICFYVRFTGFRPNKPMPESLTLVYLPRSSNDLAIDGSKIRPGSKALLGLYRVADVEKKEAGEFIFGSRERVQVSEGVRFEVYLSEERVLEGVFRRADDVEKWKLECGDDGVGVVEICVARGERRRRMNRAVDVAVIVMDGRMDGGDGEGEGEGGWRPDCEKVEMELEGVRWAIDVGVWVMCLGVGYMVARASAKSLRRSRFL
ncbi:putative proteinDP-SPECIFIC GLUTAMATE DEHYDROGENASE [Salix koriyanagi]|uniref:Uncharacterized protein n=1 Tax=Salix koriyanagi TaxID=2511006 RepID=A0A9Q0SZN4_9ROSI|nr:putative proteinDP-SPECIFIC GLUTAMATE DEHYDROGENASE [Salix koriyanagi]